MSKAIRKRISRARRAASVISAPTTLEVSKAMMHHAQTGEWPEDARPVVIEIAQMLVGASEAMSANTIGRMT
jgi:hypothetical protein